MAMFSWAGFVRIRPPPWRGRSLTTSDTTLRRSVGVLWMAARILDGKKLAETIRGETAAAAAAFAKETGSRPGLAAVLVGENPASQVYVRNKRKACEQVGIDSWLHELP